MGKCKVCEQEIKPKTDETEHLICPNCGANPYECWHCHASIKARNECRLCGFYECEECHECGKNCKVNVIANIIEKENIDDKRELIRFIINEALSKDRIVCPRDISISHAKNTIHSMQLKINGSNVKSETDKIAWNERITQLQSKPIGFKWTITQMRDDGSEGREDRIASNFLVCTGQARKKVMQKRNSKGNIIKSYEEFERIDLQPCQFFNEKNLKIDSCQLPRKEFKKKEESVKGDLR